MKKLLLLVTLCLLLALTLSLSLWIDAADDTVTVNSTTSLADALSRVPDGGTVKIESAYTIPSDFIWTAHGKTVTVTGGVLDFTSFGNNGHFNIRDNVTFTGIELKFAPIEWNAESNEDATAKSDDSFPRTNIYANGYDLTIAADVTFTEGLTYNTNVCLFGGSKGGTVNGNTNLTVLAGWYTCIFGGGHGGTVNGSTHVTVGGNVNSTAVISNHDSNYNAYGGGWDDNITGSTYITVQDSARLIYAYGGSHEGSSKVGGTTNVLFNGGTLMSIYGAHKSGANTATASNVLMTGGTVDQIFGGSNGASFGTAAKPVDANVTVLGGTVTRRIYGGCYNEFKSDLNFSIGTGLTYGKWDTTKYQVYGHITVTVSDGCNISYSYSDGITTADKGLYARSRLSTYNGSGSLPTADETSTLIFLGSYQSSKLKAQDTVMQTIMSTVATAADEIHTIVCTADGSVLTQTCNGQGHDADASGSTAASTSHTVATATLQTADTVYTGITIENATVTYSDGWIGTKPAVSYQNNLHAGTATASLTCGGATVSKSFTIAKATSSTPTAGLFTVANESIKGKADGSISCATLGDMEYSTDGTSYRPITGSTLSGLAAGSYYLRYVESDDRTASSAVQLTIAAGRMLTVTFRAAGSADVTREVEWNSTVSNVPAVPTRAGYDRVTPTWDTDTFSGICEDLVINAVYTPNTYTVIFIIEGTEVHRTTVSHGNALPTVQIPEREGHTASWKNAPQTVTSDLTLTAEYTLNQYSVIFFVGSSAIGTRTVLWGEAVTDLPTIPTQEGYTASWNTDLSCVKSNLTVKAVYTPIIYTVIFRVEGQTDVIREVRYGEAVTDIPPIPTKRGYDKTAPVWNADLTAIKSDLTVTPIYTKNPAGVANNTTNGQAATLGNGWESVITNGDRAEMDLGENVSIYLQTAGGQLTEAEQAALEALLNGYTAGSRLTISLFKQVGSTAAVKLDATTAKLTVTLQIPEELRSSERQYKLIALRNGEATAVETTYDATAQTLTLETDDFNTVYAFSYLDPAPTPEPAVKNGSSTMIIVVIAAVVVIGGAVVAVVLIKKKKKA